MKAQNLTICVPYKGCDKKPTCPYCVARMTGFIKTNESLMMKNLPKVLTMARVAQVTSVLLTGKGEPFLNSKRVMDFCSYFREFPVEVQTNGIWLEKNIDSKNYGVFQDLFLSGLNTIAISIDNPMNVYQSKTVSVITEKAHEVGILVRVTLNVTNIIKDLNFTDILNICKKWGIDQLTVRNVTAPSNSKSKESLWIKNNVSIEVYENLKRSIDNRYKFIRSLPFGSMVFDHEGIAVTYSDYCIQESNNNEDIRSIIYQEDGHCYTSWNSKASILF